MTLTQLKADYEKALNKSFTAYNQSLRTKDAYKKFQYEVKMRRYQEEARSIDEERNEVWEQLKRHTKEIESSQSQKRYA